MSDRTSNTSINSCYYFRSFFTYLCVLFCLQGCSAPIHEVSTDLLDPPIFHEIVSLRATAKASNPSVYSKIISGYGLTIDVPNAQKRYFPELTTLVISNMEYSDVFAILLDQIETMSWKLISFDKAQGRIEAFDTTRWFKFIDDIVVRVRETKEGIKVDVRSKSRNGFVDFGKNARRVSQYLENIMNALK